MSSGKGNSVTENTIRYAPYIEALHQDFVADLRSYEDDALAANPYELWTDLSMEVGFFGTGYTLGSFPSLYDMYGKFLAGLDVEILFDEALEDTLNGSAVDATIASEADILSDDLENEAYPRFEAGMRDMNSVMSSTFVVAKAMMEVGRTKALSRFSSQLRVSLIPVATERWARHLEWNKAVIESYMNILKLYITQKHDINDVNYEFNAKKALWPFTVLDFTRAAIGTMNQPQSETSKVKGGSTGQKMLGGAMSGASAGMMIGGPLGAGIGGVLGALGGLL